MAAQNIFTLSELDSSKVAQAGGKGASLGKLVASGAPVPPGFVVASSAFLNAIDLASDISGPIGLGVLGTADVTLRQGGITLFNEEGVAPHQIHIEDDGDFQLGSTFLEFGGEAEFDMEGPITSFFEDQTLLLSDIIILRRGFRCAIGLTIARLLRLPSTSTLIRMKKAKCWMRLRSMRLERQGA